MSGESTEMELAVLSLNVDTPPERVGEVLALLDGWRQRERDVRRLLEDRLAEIIRETGRDIVVGPVRYYLGTKRTTKVRDHAAALLALFEHTGGDFGRVAEFLSSDAFKHGGIRKSVGDARFAELFEVTEETELKEGKPERVRKLMKFDERFQR
jgi:hypothetical protein